MRPLTSCLVITVVLAASTTLTPSVSTASPDVMASSTASRPDDPRAKIPDRLEKRFAHDRTQDFWIRLRRDADTSDAPDARTWAAQGREVVDALTQAASNSQADVRRLLRDAGARFESYWITNAIHVTGGTERIAQRIAALDGVAELRLPRTYDKPDPVSAKPARMQAAGVEWGVADINADDVWDQYDTRGDGVVVASIDSGAQFDHPALVDSYRGNNGDGTFTHDYNWFDASGQCGGAPCDGDAQFSHGTHTMGTMVGDDGQGNQIGVAPGVQWITANGCATCTDADLLASAQWMLAPTKLDGSAPDPAKRPDVINNSWGSQVPSIDPFLEDMQQAWADAGIFAVWANGNIGEAGCASAGSPGSRTLNYSVGAYDADDQIAYFSSRGPGQDGEIKPNISAPGVDVRSAQSRDAYQLLSGTSMAAPHVTGAVALLWSAYPELERDVEATRTLLDLSAIDTPDDQCGGTPEDNNVYGEGRLDALALLDLAATGLGTLSGTVTDSETGDPVTPATITVSGPIEQQTTTDSDGDYERRLPPGDYDVTVTAFGYTEQTGQVTVGKDQTVTADFALESEPTVTVEGTVTEGSDHGWPLYATLTVEGMPNGTFYTDPFDGDYTMTLPAGATYDVTVDPRYPGIPTRAETLAVGDGDDTADFELAADPYDCTAPGYQPSESQVHYEQTFDDPTTPADWTVVDNIGNGQVWRFDDEEGFGNRTGGDGYYGWVFSAGYGEDAQQDTELVSPVVDLTSTETPAIWFNTDYSDGASSTADVDVSVDGGDTWTNAWRQTVGSIDEARVQVPIPQAAGESNVRFRFHYTASFDTWWMVDNAAVGERVCDTVDGGLLAGYVRDANTDEALVGATVRSDEQADLTTSAVATPDDTALDDGFYWMFAPLTGSHPFTASMARYQDDGRDIDVTADATTATDFAPTAGQLDVSTATIDKTVRLGGSATATVTVGNDGSAPTAISLAETPGGSTTSASATGAPLQRIRGDFSPYPSGAASGNRRANTATGPSTLPWTAATDYPTPVTYNVAGFYNGKVYAVGGLTPTGPTRDGYVYDPARQTWKAITDLPRARLKPASGFIGGKLYVAGGWTGNGQVRADMDVYNARTNTWTAGPALPSAIAASGAAVVDGRLYVVGGCQSSCGHNDVMRFDPSTGRWKSLADYPEKTAWLACGGIDGVLYCAGGVSDNGGSTATRAYAYDPATNTWTRRADLPIDLWGTGTTVADGMLLLSGGVTDDSHAVTNEGFGYDPGTDTWSPLPKSNQALYAGASACGFYKVGGSSLNDDSAAVEELAGYARCRSTNPVPWLSATSSTTALQPGDELTVKVVVDTARMGQPGTYTADLAIRNDTPYRTEIVDVTAHVKPPIGWGKITGAVSGRRCDGTTSRLPGATVKVEGTSATSTLTTDADGRYARWLDHRQSPLKLTVTKSGWSPKTVTARISAGNTTTRNVTLTKSGC